MAVGSVIVELNVDQSQSLKDKRRIVKSLLARIGDRFNASTAEIDARDSRQRAVIEIAIVRTSSREVDSGLTKIVDFLRAQPAAILVTFDIEIF